MRPAWRENNGSRDNRTRERAASGFIYASNTAVLEKIRLIEFKKRGMALALFAASHALRSGDGSWSRDRGFDGCWRWDHGRAFFAAIHFFIQTCGLTGAVSEEVESRAADVT